MGGPGGNGRLSRPSQAMAVDPGRVTERYPDILDALEGAVASGTRGDAQFTFINGKATAFQQQSQLVISVDTKKKELIGNYKNSGREYYPRAQAPQANVYEFGASVRQGGALRGL